jgi:hypothetical protein
MQPKPKNLLASGPAPAGILQPRTPHDVTNQSAATTAILRRRPAAPAAVTGTASHARHHVPRSSQA